MIRALAVAGSLLTACGNVDSPDTPLVRWATACPQTDPKKAVLCVDAQWNLDPATNEITCVWSCHQYLGEIAQWTFTFVEVEPGCWEITKQQALPCE